MTDEDRAELTACQKDFGRLKARVTYSINRGEERLRYAFRGEKLPANPMELSDVEWDAARVEVEAFNRVLSRKGR